MLSIFQLCVTSTNNISNFIEYTELQNLLSAKESEKLSYAAKETQYLQDITSYETQLRNVHLQSSEKLVESQQQIQRLQQQIAGDGIFQLSCSIYVILVYIYKILIICMYWLWGDTLDWSLYDICMYIDWITCLTFVDFEAEKQRISEVVKLRDIEVIQFKECIRLVSALCTYKYPPSIWCIVLHVLDASALLYI